MALAEYRLRANVDDRFGAVCYDCGGPKSLQAERCFGCFKAALSEKLRLKFDYHAARTCPGCGGWKRKRESVRCDICARSARRAA